MPNQPHKRFAVATSHFPVKLGDEVTLHQLYSTAPEAIPAEAAELGEDQYLVVERIESLASDEPEKGAVFAIKDSLGSAELHAIDLNQTAELSEFHQRDKLHAHETEEELVSALVDTWASIAKKETIPNDSPCVITSNSPETVQILNDQCQEKRRQETADKPSASQESAFISGGQRFYLHDRVVTNQKLGTSREVIGKGTLGTVVGVDQEANSIEVAFDDEQRSWAMISLEDLEPGSVDLAYALEHQTLADTPHKVSRILVHQDGPDIDIRQKGWLPKNADVFMATKDIDRAVYDQKTKIQQVQETVKSIRQTFSR